MNPNAVDWDALETVPVRIGGTELEVLANKHKSAYQKGIDPTTDVGLVEETKQFVGKDPMNEGRLIDMLNQSEIKEGNPNAVDWESLEATPQVVEKPSLPVRALEAGRTGIIEGVKYGGKTLYHTAGAMLGTVNAPNAFVWGMLGAELEDPQQFYKLPGWQKLAVSLGGGFVSALESIAKPGSWGKQASDYYKGVTGRSIQESLEGSLKERGFKDPKGSARLVAPMVETLYNLIADPTTALVPAAQLAKLRTPKGFVGTIPKHIQDQIEYLNALDDIDLQNAVKAQLRNAYDEKLWGIQEGGTFQNVKPFRTGGLPPQEAGIVEGATFPNAQQPPTPPSGRSGGTVISGETLPNVWPNGQPRLKDVPPGGIVEGESVGPTVGMNLKVGVPRVETTQRPPGVAISGAQPPAQTPMGVQVPREPTTIPEAASRIMDIAKNRTAAYVLEAELAKAAGVGASGFITKTGKRLGLPSYQDLVATQKETEALYGVMIDQLAAKTRPKPFSQEVKDFDLGCLVQAAREVFGPDETMKALRLLENEDSQIGRTLKAAMPELEKTLGSGQFTQPFVQEAKAGRTVVPRGTPPQVKAQIKNLEDVDKARGEAAKKRVESMQDILKRGRGETPVPKVEGTPKLPPKPVAKVEPQPQRPTKDSDLNRLIDEDVDETMSVVDELEEATGVRVNPSAEDVIVPGKTFKHIVPKVGEKIPGVGEITGQIALPNGTFWFRYIDEKTGVRRYKSMDTIMEMAQSYTPPRDTIITLDFMGISDAFRLGKQAIRDFRVKLEALKSKYGTGTFQTQIPDDALYTPDWDKTVKRRRTATYNKTPIFAPPVKGLERNVIFNANELPGGLYREHLENPIRNFEYAGQELKELIYYPIKEAEHTISLERKKFDTWLKGLRSQVSFESAHRIGVYAIAQQKRMLRDPKTKQNVLYQDGIERLKGMGITDIPKLTDDEMRVYKIVRDKFDEMYDRLSVARIAGGHKPFPKVENYVTYVLDFKEMEARGMHPLLQGDKVLNPQFIHPSATPLKSAKPRGKTAYPVETNIFGIMEGYMPQAIKHIHMTPRIAKMRELLGVFVNPKTGDVMDKVGLSQTKPNLYNFLNNWLTFQTGVRPTSSFWDKGQVGRVVNALNRNLTFALLSGNLRTMLIQSAALRNTVGEIGAKNTALGVEDMMRVATGNSRLWKEAFAKSNVLLGRAYDVSAQQAFDAIREGKWGSVKTALGRAGMKPIQWLDIGTAWMTWRGAYRKALSEGLADTKAARYADDVVVKTQASGAASDVAPIQRTSAGRALTLLQTFVINDWGFFLRDVIGRGNPRISKKEGFTKLLKYVTATTALNVLYEDVLGMNSPFPTPIRAAQEALEQGDDEVSGSWIFAKELLENMPIMGGAIRYGVSPFGAPVELVGQGFEMLQKGASPAKIAEWVAKAKGIPGTGMVSRYAREEERGEPLWPRLAGKRTITSQQERENKALWD